MVTALELHGIKMGKLDENEGIQLKQDSMSRQYSKRHRSDTHCMDKTPDPRDSPMKRVRINRSGNEHPPHTCHYLREQHQTVVQGIFAGPS